MSGRVYKPAVSGGVLLARNSDVHRDLGKAITGCGKRFSYPRVATVSDVAAIVHKLPLCRVCYPDPGHTHRRSAA